MPLLDLVIEPWHVSSEHGFSDSARSTGFPPATARMQPIPSIYIQRQRRQDERYLQNLI